MRRRSFGEWCDDSATGLLDLLERGVLALEGEVTWQHRYELGDPFEIVARRQERDQRKKESKQEKAKRELESLFEREEDEAEYRNTAK